MKRTFVVTILAGILAVLAVSPALAQPHPGSDMCPHDPTIGSVPACIVQMEEMDVIDSAGVANSLQAKLAAAQSTQDRGQSDVAVRILTALMHQLEAQSGKHIAEPHASHLIQHVEMVISQFAA